MTDFADLTILLDSVPLTSTRRVHNPMEEEQVAAPSEPHVFVADSDFTLYVGDVRDVLLSLPDESVHCVVTSPPYWGLRDYAVDGQLGLEATPDLYVQSMVAVFREVRRVLRRDGTCWLNLGDSYAQSGGQLRGENETQERAIERQARRGTSTGQHGGWESRASRAANTAVSGLKPKDLVGIPWRVAFALQADGWYLRSDIIWSKPNPMPESVSDRPTKAHEYLFLLTRSARYFYDADAIREPHLEPWRGNGEREEWTTDSGIREGMGRASDTLSGWGVRQYNAAGRNRRSVWEISTEAFPDAHFATFPQALVEPCVKAGSSERGCCAVCGAPWERETATEFLSEPTYKAATAEQALTEGRNRNVTRMGAGKRVETTGWRAPCDCVGDGHHVAVPCTVLDPFMGSGTTALVARRLGRRCVGVELNPTYAELAARRLSQLSLLA